MTAPQAGYYFDQWAENLTINLAENIARCHLGHNKVERVRINLNKLYYWPKTFKVILDNNLVAKCNAHKPVLEDNSYAIEYIYPTVSKLPHAISDKDSVNKGFNKKAKQLDKHFYQDAWSLSTANGIPTILCRFALRSCSRLLTRQLQHQGVEISEQFSVQFHDEENFLIFSYEGLKQDLKQQMQLYAVNLNIKNLAAEHYFKHAENKKWFKGIIE